MVVVEVEGLVDVRSIHLNLLVAYGEPAPIRLDPVSQLVCTIISQNTNDELRDRAYHRLRERFPTWEEVRDAPVEEIEEAIGVAGLGPQKAPRIKRALERITREHGRLDLDFLRHMDLEKAREWLMSIAGVGPKTAAIVLLFSLELPAFPVDTHVHRVSRRLGLITPGTSAEKAHGLLEGILPRGLYFPLHVNLVRHGRKVCRARSARCEECVLQDVCPKEGVGPSPVK